MDASGESNGGDGPRLGRGRDAGRAFADGSDPLLMAVPKGNGESGLIGADAGTSTADGLETPGVFRSWSEPAPPANAPERCKFLRSIGPDGKLFEPRRDALPTHRCAAFGDPLPLSLRQQELVCLQRVHVSCPRYMRGTLLAEESATAAAKVKPVSGLPLLSLAGLALVALAGLALVAAMMGWLPGTGSAGPTGPRSFVAVANPSPTPTATPSPSHAASPSASPQLSATPKPTPSATSSWPPGATASRMDLVVPCTGQANCYVYTVRGAGENGSTVADTVAGISRFFGVDPNTVYSMNPWAVSGIHSGDLLKIPPPTK